MVNSKTCLIRLLAAFAFGTFLLNVYFAVTHIGNTAGIVLDKHPERSVIASALPARTNLHHDGKLHCESEYNRIAQNHTHGLTKEDLRRSRVLHGNEERITKFVEILEQRSRPLSVLVCGGSISIGHGVQPKTMRYSDQFELWLNDNFPLEKSGNNARHIVHNRAAHGADFCAVAKRIQLLLDEFPPGEQPDMFILEFAVNDYQGQDHKVHLDHKTDVFFDGFQRLAMCTEAVVRKLLLTHPNAAVVFLEFQTAILNRKTAQLLHVGAAQHYQVPVISYAEALFPGYYSLLEHLKPFGYMNPRSGDAVQPFPHGCAPCLDEHIAEQFRSKGCKSICTFMKRSGHGHLKCEDEQHNALPGSEVKEPCYLPFFAHDAVHPSMIGHQLAKDLIVHALAGARRSMCYNERPSRHILPPTSWLGSPQQLDKLTDFVLVQDTMQVFSKQDPLLSKNHTPGFELFGDALAERKGWIATNPKGGETVQFDVDLPEGCYELYLSVLKSYEGMGQFTVEMKNKKDIVDDSAGNAPVTTIVDGLWEPHISIPAEVKASGDGKDKSCRGKCEVTVTTHAKDAERSGNKVKILTLSARPC